jgi:DNA-binding NarL/FixJ family response regulator
LKVLIVDDHPLMLAGVRRVLERSEGIEVVGEAQAYPEFLNLVERRRPDVVLLDLRLPGVRDVEHIEELRGRWPDIRIVVLSATEDRAAIDAALAAGASAFVLKTVSSFDIPALLRQVASGTVFQAPAGERPGARAPAQADRNSSGPDLTEREVGILSAAARGLTTAQIAHELFISEHTVKFHLTNVYRKLGVSNRAGAVRWALEHDLT